MEYIFTIEPIQSHDPEAEKACLDAIIKILTQLGKEDKK
jgi:hypothetical protein